MSYSDSHTCIYTQLETTGQTREINKLIFRYGSISLKCDVMWVLEFLHQIYHVCLLLVGVIERNVFRWTDTQVMQEIKRGVERYDERAHGWGNSQRRRVDHDEESKICIILLFLMEISTDEGQLSTVRMLMMRKQMMMMMMIWMMVLMSGGGVDGVTDIVFELLDGMGLDAIGMLQNGAAPMLHDQCVSLSWWWWSI